MHIWAQSSIFKYIVRRYIWVIFRDPSSTTVQPSWRSPPTFAHLCSVREYADCSFDMCSFEHIWGNEVKLPPTVLMISHHCQNTSISSVLISVHILAVAYYQVAPPKVYHWALRARSKELSKGWEIPGRRVKINLQLIQLVPSLPLHPLFIKVFEKSIVHFFCELPVVPAATFSIHTAGPEQLFTNARRRCFSLPFFPR